MSTITASSSAFMIARTSHLRKGNVNVGVSSSSPTLGLPKMERVGKVRCSMDGKPCTQEKEPKPSITMGAPLMAAVAAAAMSSPAALALVDERMSTEGTGLPFGLSNNLLGWILLGVFALIWSLYTIYTSTLDDDEDSGLSL